MVKETIIDMAISGGLEICSEYNTCCIALKLVTVVIIIVYLLNWISRGCKCRMPTENEINRGLRAVSGIYLGRSVVISLR